MSQEQNRGAAVSVEPEVEQVFHWFAVCCSGNFVSVGLNLSKTEWRLRLRAVWTQGQPASCGTGVPGTGR